MKKCNKCEEQSTILCDKCGVATYCSQKCRKNDIHEHRDICSTLSKLQRCSKTYEDIENIEKSIYIGDLYNMSNKKINSVSCCSCGSEKNLLIAYGTPLCNHCFNMMEILYQSPTPSLSKSCSKSSR